MIRPARDTRPAIPAGPLAPSTAGTGISCRHSPDEPSGPGRSLRAPIAQPPDCRLRAVANQQSPSDRRSPSPASRPSLSPLPIWPLKRSHPMLAPRPSCPRRQPLVHQQPGPCSVPASALPWPPPGGAGAGGSPVSAAGLEAAGLITLGSASSPPPQPETIKHVAARPMPADHSIQGLIAPHSFLICPRNPRSLSPVPPSSHAPDLPAAKASPLIMQLAVPPWKGASTLCHRSRLEFISINSRSHRYVG